MASLVQLAFRWPAPMLIKIHDTIFLEDLQALFMSYIRHPNKRVLTRFPYSNTQVGKCLYQFRNSMDKYIYG